MMSEKLAPARTPQEIVDQEPVCRTMPNGTGVRCLCASACANYWLRADGYKSENPDWKRPPRLR